MDERILLSQLCRRNFGFVSTVCLAISDTERILVIIFRKQIKSRDEDKHKRLMVFEKFH